MHFSNLFFTALALSCGLWVDAAPDLCKPRPSVKTKLLTPAELTKLTATIKPKVFADGSTGLLENRPAKLAFSPKPQIRVNKPPLFDLLVKVFENIGLNNTAVLLRKEVINYSAYPFSTIGKIRIYDDIGNWFGSCSGTSVGPNLMMTASHCIPWNRGDRWAMEFIPAFNGDDMVNPRPYGQAWVTQCYGVKNVDKNTGKDYVICQLDSAIGNTIGWMGSQGSKDNDFYKRITWTSVGYPADSHSGNVQMVEEFIKLSDVDDEGSNGKELESYVYSSGGWSGGPLFHMLENGAYLGGVLSGREKEVSIWDFFTATHTLSAGGIFMVDLIKYGLANWKP